MQQGQWADLGMFMENIMLLAREHGLHTCPQEAWAVWHRIIRDYLAVPDNEMIFCGMAIGHADDTAPVNTLVSEPRTADGLRDGAGRGVIRARCKLLESIYRSPISSC